MFLLFKNPKIIVFLLFKLLKMDLDLLKLFRYLRRGYHWYESNWTRIHNHTTICYLYFISFNDMFILPIKIIVKV